MSTVPSTPEHPTPDMSTDTPSLPSQLLKPQRVLACVLCQQRKVKCDHKFPCVNCIKSRAQCVPAAHAQRRRRRRFPERALLERLRKYEDLLRQNNVTFEPLHKDSTGEKGSLNVESGDDSDDEHPETVGPDRSTLSTTVKSQRDYEAKNVWHAMSLGFRDPDNDSDSSHDDVRETAVKKAWDQAAGNSDHLLFGSRRTDVDLSTLHPDPVQIFRLWQIYLDNVNPLLKVTHTPSLQGRIIEAASNVRNIDPTLEALMFSIYCTSILSLIGEDCQTMFGSAKEDLLMRYQFSCQEALSNCGFLRSSDRDCLTALYLYLVSVRSSTVPQSLSSMLGVATRIAHRMGIHSESALTKCTALEAEMRRRLWWSLILFDTRIGELSNSKTVTLDPTWDCKIPLNVNDSELRPEMKGPPAVQGKSTEALFVVVRSELGDFIRHTGFHLDFTSPALKSIAKHLQNGPAPEGGELVKLEEMIEDQYLKSCDQENPIHFMTIWTTRAYLAKCRLLEHHSRLSRSSVRRTEVQRNAATSYALRILECDTKIMTSPLTKGYLWLNHIYFPFPAYIQIAQDLKRRPIDERARQAWEVMSDNYEAWFVSHFRDDSPFFQVFSQIALQAWEACEAASKQLGETLTPPRIVSCIRHTLAQIARHARNTDTELPNTIMGMAIDEFAMPMPMGFADQSLPYSMGMQDGNAVMRPEIYPGIPGQAPLDAHMDQVDWTALALPACQIPGVGKRSQSYSGIYEKVDPVMHWIEKMSPALSTRMNSLNFILNERGCVLARWVAAGVGLTRNASKGQELQEFENTPDISAISSSINDNTIRTNRVAVSVDKKPSAGVALESSPDPANMMMNDWIQRKSGNFLWLPHEYRSAR